MPSSGDPCHEHGCIGTLRVRTSRRIGSCQEKRYECGTCGAPGGIDIVPLSEVFPRKDHADLYTPKSS